MPRTRIAFNDPTNAGVCLAKSYIGNKNNDSYILHLYYPSLNNKLLLNNLKKFDVKQINQINNFDNTEKENNFNPKKRINCFGFEEEDEDSN